MSILLATVIVALVGTVSAQRYDGRFWPCNPLTNGTNVCTPNPGLPTSTYSIDFTQQTAIPANWTLSNYATINFSSTLGAEFTYAKRYDAPQLYTDFFILFGRVSVEMRIANGTGMISSSVLISDDFDEIDFELSGNNFNLTGTGKGQNNYFGKGITGAYNRGEYFDVTDPQDTFHTYTFDWSKDRLNWEVDGTAIRTFSYINSTTATESDYQYPQTPSKLQLGIWAGGDPGQNSGTISWAGGITDVDGGPYTMYIRKVTIENANPGSAYNWTDTSGTWQSIEVLGEPVVESGSTSTPVISSASTTPTSSSTTSSGAAAGTTGATTGGTTGGAPGGTTGAATAGATTGGATAGTMGGVTSNAPTSGNDGTTGGVTAGTSATTTPAPGPTTTGSAAGGSVAPTSGTPNGGVAATSAAQGTGNAHETSNAQGASNAQETGNAAAPTAGSTANNGGASDDTDNSNNSSNGSSATTTAGSAADSTNASVNNSDSAAPAATTSAANGGSGSSNGNDSSSETNASGEATAPGADATTTSAGSEATGSSDSEQTAADGGSDPAQTSSGDSAEGSAETASDAAAATPAETTTTTADAGPTEYPGYAAYSSAVAGDSSSSDASSSAPATYTAGANRLRLFPWLN